MVEIDELCEISLEDFEKLKDFHNMRRMSKEEFLREFKETILEWLMRNEEALRIAMEKYSWRNKNHEESVKERNALELAIKQSRRKNYGGIDLETADKIHLWGFSKIFPLRDSQKVVEITKKAFEYIDQGDYYQGAKTLMGIRGVGISRATKIIGLSDQNRLCIYDSRVGHALRSLRKNSAKVILCPPDMSYKRDCDQTSKNGWAMNYERLIWTLQIMLKYFNAKSLYFRMADIEMALFVLGEGNGGKCYG